MRQDVSLIIDEKKIVVSAGTSILKAAEGAGIYIPHLCAHPDLPPAGHCGLCLVQVEGYGELMRACVTPVEQGMVISTSSSEIAEKRKFNLAAILANHPHACLTCAQKEGCSRTQCSSNVSEEERCCEKLGSCELEKVADYIGIPDNLPRYSFASLPVIGDEPLFIRNYNLCVGCTRCVRACQNLRGVGALTAVYWGERILVGPVAPSLIEAGCRFCGACVEVCPTGALRDKIPAKDRENLVPCRVACPAGVNVPAYIRLLKEGKYSLAALVIRQQAPFPAVLGRVCFHPCENVCRRAQLDEPVSICRLKCFAAEHDPGSAGFADYRPQNREEKVAVVGSGPAGLTAAYFLAWAGCAVTVFEALPQPGGMLRVGIPEFRLPREVLDKEIREVEKLGVKICLNTPVNSLEELRKAGFAAVVLALGAHKSLVLGIPGEELPGVFTGVDFLRKVNLGEITEVSGKVAVIGGGNVALDAARCALRLGAAEVEVFYRRSETQMPAFAEEVAEAKYEGVKFSFLTAPVSISRNKNLVLELLQMKLKGADESGRPRPVPVEGSNFQKEFDLIIVAIGQKPGYLQKDSPLSWMSNGSLESKEGVFACGDMVTGPASVVEAVAGGKKIAESVYRYLTGEQIPWPSVSLEKSSPWLGRREDFAPRKRLRIAKRPWQGAKGQCSPAERRIMCFQEIEEGFDEFLALEEADRCLRCDLRLNIQEVDWPPVAWLPLTAEEIAKLPAKGGVFQLLDGERNVILISGTANLQEGLRHCLNSGEFPEARYFLYEKDPMYTKRESELLNQYVQKYGSLPKGNDLLSDDLF